MTFFKALVAASLVAYAAAECPNACSGHGTCSKFDMCTCYRNWQAADCSQRTCPFDLAHVDTPKGDLDHDNRISDADASAILVGSTVYPSGTNEAFPKMEDSGSNTIDNSAHAYMECSNKGICDRTTGTCECFDGYDGAACQRASCPNACSGHGTCESISHLASREFANVYALWDKDATMGCNCDAGYGAADCSTRQCKHGVDPLYSDDAYARYYKASYKFSGSANQLPATATYSIIFTDIFGEDYETPPIKLSDDCASIQSQLTASIPNDAISTSTCTKTVTGDASSGFTTVQVDLDFDGNPGNISPIKINQYLDGARSTITSSDGSAVTLQEWTRQIGEDTDHFASKCAGVSVLAKLSGVADTSWETNADTIAMPGSVGYLSQSSASFALLAVCLGDSDGDVTNNVDVYNWDHGGVDHKWGAAAEYVLGSYPHAIKVQDSTGASEYLLTWYDNTSTRHADQKMRLVNMPTFSDSTSLDVYTTNGVVQMLGKDINTANVNPTDTDGVFSVGKNETKLTGYFNIYDKKIYTNFDGSCESTGDYYSKLHNCLEKGDLLFVVDGCWSDGALGEYFGGTTAMGGCAAGTVTRGAGMLYTINKIYSKPWTANTTKLDADYVIGSKGQEDRFVIEVDHNLIWDGSAIGNPDNSVDSTSGRNAGFSGLVVLFKFVPATDGSSYTYVSECANRGACDRETGLCSCFKGYTGDDCSSQNSLAI